MAGTMNDSGAQMQQSVFDITQLHEMILLHLSVEQLYHSQAVKKQWRDTIATSMPLRQKLFLQLPPMPPNRPLHCRLISNRWRPQRPTQLCLDCSVHAYGQILDTFTILASYNPLLGPFNPEGSPAARRTYCGYHEVLEVKNFRLPPSNRKQRPLWAKSLITTPGHVITRLDYEWSLPGTAVHGYSSRWADTLILTLGDAADRLLRGPGARSKDFVQGRELEGTARIRMKVISDLENQFGQQLRVDRMMISFQRAVVLNEEETATLLAGETL